MDEKIDSRKPRKQKQLGPAPIASFEDTSSDSELKFKVSVEQPPLHRLKYDFLVLIH